MDTIDIACICHQVNKAYCEALRDFSQVDWHCAPDWQRASAINGVNFHLINPDAGPEHSHNEWLKEKTADGWKYGPTKNEVTKEHPCFVPYDELPPEQQMKDKLFISTVRTLIS